ncbi:hypothetical protein [Nocardia sp. NPDC019395]|uniref:hypothetical protein n=1 Tax=Nocardia sp. NPDC019395 TaxID=3154686 RepID=UPI0033FA71EF
MRHRSFRTLAAAVSIAAAGLGAAGTAAANPVQLTEAAPIQNSGATETGTGSAALLPALLPLLASGSGTPEEASGTTTSTGSAETLLPVLLPLLASGSATPE